MTENTIDTQSRGRRQGLSVIGGSSCRHFATHIRTFLSILGLRPRLKTATASQFIRRFASDGIQPGDRKASRSNRSRRLGIRDRERKMSNLFADLPDDLSEELVETIANSKHVRIERIVSTGHSSPEGFWYDQDEHEWVVVLKGEARLVFEDVSEPVHLKVGDHINIPAHQKHRVEWTTPDEPTIWLAVFVDSDR